MLGAEVRLFPVGENNDKIMIRIIKITSEGLAQKFVFTLLVPTTFATVSPLLFG